MKILGVMWFNTCGIVRVETEYEGIEYYIKSIGVVAKTEEEDMKDIADWGSRFPNDAGDVLFKIGNKSDE